MTPAAEGAYLAAALLLYADLPDTPFHPSPQDHALAPIRSLAYFQPVVTELQTQID